MTQQAEIYDRSSYTRGYQEKRADAAVRFSFADNLPSGSAISSALDALVSLTHPIDPTLPIYSATGQRLTDTSAFAISRYARGRTSTPTQPAAKLIRKVAGSMDIEWWERDADEDGNPRFDATTGLPNGPVNYVLRVRDQIGSPTKYIIFQPYRRTVPVTLMLMPTVLDYDPTDSVKALVDKTNQNDLTINGLTYKANTLLFQRADVEPVEVYGGVRYVVQYRWIERTETWVHQQVKYDIAVSGFIGISVPIVQTVASKPQVNMSLASFPVHA